MTAPTERNHQRVGTLRPNQLLHTYGVGSVADLPNLSVMMMGLDYWQLQHAAPVIEDRLLTAVRARLGQQVETLRQPPHLPETSDVFAEWARTGVPVGLFPSWLRCSHNLCNRLGRADGDLFQLVRDAFQPDKVRYVHTCRGNGNNRPTAVPARFVLACEAGHLDDFPWQYFVHRGHEPESGHTLRLTDASTTGEAASVYVRCSCDQERSMADAFGAAAERSLPLCRGRHPHLGVFEECANQTRTLALGATNSWFAMLLRAFSLPRASEPVDQLVAEFWSQLELLAGLPAATAKPLMRTQFFWPELEPYGVDKVWEAITRYGVTGPRQPDDDEDLRTPEWREFAGTTTRDLPDFSTRGEPVPPGAEGWLSRVVLVTRLREVAALYGFTRIDAPEWDELDGSSDTRRARLSELDPTWVPCAEMRGEGIFLRFDEQRIAEWERGAEVVDRARRLLLPAHERWREQRRLPPDNWPGVRYVLLHTFAHVLIRELALESGYSASGIGERIYARSGADPMAGVLLYTAAPDSEGTLGGLVSLGGRDTLGAMVERALEAARLCGSDPLCAEHDPREHGRLYGAACHACLFAAETSCERGNQYLDRALLVDTLATVGCGFFR